MISVDADHPPLGNAALLFCDNPILGSFRPRLVRLLLVCVRCVHVGCFPSLFFFFEMGLKIILNIVHDSFC